VESVTVINVQLENTLNCFIARHVLLDIDLHFLEDVLNRKALPHVLMDNTLTLTTHLVINAQMGVTHASIMLKHILLTV
jgi:hypothetical protein